MVKCFCEIFGLKWIHISSIHRIFFKWHREKQSNFVLIYAKPLTWTIYVYYLARYIILLFRSTATWYAMIMIRLFSQASEHWRHFVTGKSCDSVKLSIQLFNVWEINRLAFSRKCLEQLNAFYYPRSSGECNTTHSAVPVSINRSTTGKMLRFFDWSNIRWLLYYLIIFRTLFPFSDHYNI